MPSLKETVSKSAYPFLESRLTLLGCGCGNGSPYFATWMSDKGREAQLAGVECNTECNRRADVASETDTKGTGWCWLSIAETAAVDCSLVSDRSGLQNMDQ